MARIKNTPYKVETEEYKTDDETDGKVETEEYKRDDETLVPSLSRSESINLMKHYLGKMYHMLEVVEHGSTSVPRGAMKGFRKDYSEYCEGLFSKTRD